MCNINTIADFCSNNSFDWDLYDLNFSIQLMINLQFNPITLARNIQIIRSVNYLFI